MPLSSFLLLFVVLLCFGLIVVGVTRYRTQKSRFNKPTILGISSLLLQILLYVLFFSERLSNLNEMTVNIIWWGTVIFGFVIGIRESKNNIVVSLVSCFLSVLLALLKLLLLLITSM